ncbi:MFS transporter [Streptomyces sp. NPDC048604]|uniref:MFS transporter n=1 Tax=Streptomyces sp. NPDC048604 TaxID=3365578 RepID=UPI0037146E76
MRTYRELFRTPEFTPFFVVLSTQIAAMTVAGLGLATLVYRDTGSPLLSALALFGPSLAQVIGAATLLSAADRLPPRAAIVGIALLFALSTAAQALPGLPLVAVFSMLFAQGLIGSVGGGVRMGLLHDILAREGYLLGRSLLNIAVGVCQIAGYGAGGLLVALLSPRGALVTGAVLYVCAALCARFGLSRRAPRASGRPSVAESWRVNRRLWSLPARRRVYLALWVPNGLIVGCESLFVPYDPEHAALLFGCAAAGMLAGDLTVGRFLPERWRGRLASPLQVLLAAPFLLFAFRPGLPVAAVAVAVATVGYGASLLFQERLMALTPQELSGQALGLHSSGMLTLQGVSATLAGVLAQRTSTPTAMTVLAGLSLAVTAALAYAEERGTRDRKPGSALSLVTARRSEAGATGRSHRRAESKEP